MSSERQLLIQEPSYSCNAVRGGNLDKQKNLSSKGILWDRIHPTSEGYRLYANNESNQCSIIVEGINEYIDIYINKTTPKFQIKISPFYANIFNNLSISFLSDKLKALIKLFKILYLKTLLKTY